MFGWDIFVGQVKKQGKPTDLSQFRAQLDALGLKIVHVTADGNCFFRSVLICAIYIEILLLKILT